LTTASGRAWFAFVEPGAGFGCPTGTAFTVTVRDNGGTLTDGTFYIAFY
jgi:hypothetical protein